MGLFAGSSHLKVNEFHEASTSTFSTFPGAAVKTSRWLQQFCQVFFKTHAQREERFVSFKDDLIVCLPLKTLLSWVKI